VYSPATTRAASLNGCAAFKRLWAIGAIFVLVGVLYWWLSH
jgi:hypothetical protein